MVTEKVNSCGKYLKAVILAGGLGTRLRSVVAERQKVLAEVNRRPFLAYLLDQLAEADIRSVILCTGYLGEQVSEIFGSSYAGLEIVYSFESSPLGTAGALKHAEKLLSSDAVLVMNGDSYCSVDLKGFWEWHCGKRASGSLVLAYVPDTGRFGRVQFDDRDMVTRFDEKGAQRGPGWINAGIYLLGRSLIQSIPESRKVSLEREMFPLWISGGNIYGFRSEGIFLDIGTPEDYVVAERMLSRSIG